jgi:hypothetical protein
VTLDDLLDSDENPAASEPQMIAVDLSKIDRAGERKLIGGSQSDQWNDVIIRQTVQSLWLAPSDKPTCENQCLAATAALVGIGPNDEIEGMIAAQMIATHNAAMECFRRAMGEQQSLEGRQANLGQANKLVRSYAVLVEALNRHRGKVQKVQLEHVTVHAGGQAIVGTVEAQGISKHIKAEERPHALGYAPSPTVWSKNEKQREAVPIAGDGERQVLRARRNVAGG